MTHYLHRNFARRLAGLSLVAISCLAAGLSARAVNLVQDFYLPMPESQINSANNAIISGSSSTITSTFSIVVTGTGTVIYYDQWEDGYETDLSNPTQASTQIWGDGNDANGIPPGFAHDPVGLPAGTVITLTNSVPQPRNPSTLLWDARDHIAATKALVISRAGWPVTPGPVFAGAVGVLSTMDYGTNYISPVGQNLTNINLMKYVGMFIMAAQNNTAVAIDPNGNGVGVTNIVLNQGESYLVNGGILKGGRVTSTKPIQADLIIGHVGASYASDWFTLYPASEWDNSYYTPVSTSASGNPAYVYLYNPNTNAITINYNTKAGSGSFPVPGTNGVFQFQMPVGSGAGFASAGGQNFYALCTVAANNSADTAYNWGFTLVPKMGLTTEATVGWGPGSADGTVDGSPVWVTALANTTLYVDYKGDHAGPLSYTNNGTIQFYDTNFTVTALQSLKIYDPSKNQTGMRVFTVDGTLLTAAWGEDPDVAAPGNPYIDAGTTVLPFPVPVLKKSAVIITDTPPANLSVGDTILYTVEVDNKGLLPLGNTLVIDAPSTNLLYVTNSTTFNGAAIPDSVSGTAFPLDAPGYTIPVILSQGSSTFTYMCKVTAGGVVSNSVNIGGSSIFSATTLAPAPAGGASVTINFSDTNGVPASLYSVGTNVFVTMTNAAGNTSSNLAQTISVTVVDVTHGDLQTITLTETGTNSGVFRNITGLPTSASAGLGPQDGTLNIAPGDTLSVSYTDPNYGDSATNTAAIQIPAFTKQLYLSVNGSSTNGVQDLNRIDPVFYTHSPTRTSVDIGSAGSGSTGTVALSNNGFTGLTNSLSRATLTNNFTVAAVNNQLMLVGIASRTTQASSVTFSNFNMGHIGYISAGSGSGAVDVWALTNPPAITANVIVTFSSATAIGACFGATTFTNVNTNAPMGAIFTATGTTGNPAVTVVSTNKGMVYDIVSVDSQTPSATPATGQTSLFYYSSASSGSGWTSGGASITNGANGNVTMSWTSASHTWAAAGISINPMPIAGGSGGPATNVTTFAQTPAFYSAFTMPSNNLVIITNYIAVTNGVMPANPAVTATLQYGGTNIITLSNPTYSSVNSNLVWSGLLTTNVTVPSGQLISYVISNGQSGVSFHVDYDSTNKPSKIVLPASTVIAINTLGVYDAPYPNGNLVTSPVAGSTLYVRANVSDPFGSYDVTSLGLAITAPVTNANVNTVLNDANVVTNDLASKTYEFAWNTGPTTGSYAIAATANEGTEGVTASAGASLSLIFLDLGTPSTTVFTSGSNGSTTNAYPASAAGSVCVRVTDLNRNTNSATAENIVVTVSSSAGDSEIITLAETGTNTGVFANCIATSTNSGVTPFDGTLYAPVGSVLTASYSDPTDPTDNTSATATITPLPGVSGVKMNKTIVSPTGGQTGIGQPVTYNLQVVNTGSTTLTNVVVTDNFPSAKLSYSSASKAPTTIAAGVLTWTNLGSFASGQSTNFTVTFTTLAAGSVTNSATANGVTATNSSSVILLVTHTALNVTKIVLSPTNNPVSISSNVVFRITIQNTGDTVISSLPFEDNFSGAYYQFVSATIPPDGAGAGSLIWTNLAAATPLATNAIITNDVTMKVVGQGNPANNTAVADFAVDVFGNAVPTASCTTGLVTSAASVTGHVYNDINHNGVFTNGDTGLGDVTLQLFTDPNGDGNPVDGALVQIVTTDANGYYELLNLTLGHYVVVETDLPGYASSAPVNNRLAFNLTTLTATNGNNFFDYLPSPVSYSTISGKVWNDANGNGTNDVTETNGLANVSIDLVQDVNTNGLVDSGEPVVASATTDASGNYSFAGITTGNYVIRETDPYGYYSTGDSQPPNNNQISFTATNGIVSTNNNFFDRLSPVAVNDTNSAFFLTPVLLSPLTNDISPNGDALTITTAATTNGILVINPGSTNLTFTPTNAGPATITYTMADAHGGTSNAVITVSIIFSADVGLGKTALQNVYAASNLTYTISVTNFGPSGASSVVVTDTLPTGVTFVSASGGGSNVSGVVTWNLGTLLSAQVSNVTVTVTAPASGSLTNIASVNSPTGDPNLTNNVTPPVVTGVIPLADVSVSKTGPAGIIFGTNFNYTISVTNFGPSTATALSVTDSLPVGLAFVSSIPATTTNASSQVIWTNLGNLISGATTNLTVTVISTARGTVTNIASGGSPTLDPNLTNNVGTPVVTAITNFPPLANPDNFSIAENSGTNILSPLVNDVVRTPGGSLTIIGVSPTNGTAAISGTNVLFAPNTNFLGAATIGYTITDNVGGTNIGLITVNVTNRPPVAVNDSASTPKNAAVTVPVLVNDFDPDGNPLSIVGVNPTNGIAAISGTNVVFTPTNNFLGTTFVGYTITDGNGGTNSALITVLVTNRPPVAVNDSASASENVAVTIHVLLNDSDPDGDTLTIIGVSPTNGLASISGTNVIFTPTNNFIGTAHVGYTVIDGFGGTNSALITVTVTNVPPLANPDFYSMAQNTTNTFSPLTNDVVLTPGGSLTIIGVNPTNGLASISGTNIIFTPTNNFVGTATIGYTIIDNVGGTNSSLITVNVTNVPPVAFGQPVATTENTAKAITLAGSDPASLPLTFSIVNAPTNGTLSLLNTNTGAVTYTPNTNYVGNDSFTFRVNNGYNNSTSATVAITVTNLPPLANPDNYTVLENSTNTFSPLTNDIVNTPGGTLSIVSISATNGAATISGTNIIFTPTNNFTGTATVGYIITDGIGGTNSSVITVAVLGVADVAVSKTGPTNVFAATNFSYTITVTNLGPAAASSLSVTDNLPSAVSFVSATVGVTTNGSLVVWTNLGSLAAGAATNLTVTVAAPVNGINLTNLASGGSPTSDPNPTNNTSLPVVTTVMPIANLAVGKTGSPSVSALSALTYTISVTNFGPSTAISVVVTDALPAGVTFVSASGNGSNVSGVVNWNLGALASGQISNVTVVVTAPANGSLTNIASVSSPTTDTNTTDNVTPPVITTVTGIADLGLGKTALPSVYAASNLTYTISVTNFGPSTASGVVVTDALPAGVTFVGASGNGATNGGAVIWNLSSLANGAVSNLTLTVTAPASGSLTNIASVGSPNVDPNLTNNVTPPVVTSVTPLADIAIGKSGPAGITFNTAFNYTISVTNFGPSTAAALSVTDSLPAGLVFVSAVPSAATNASNQVIWSSLGSLAANTTTNLTLTVTSILRGSVTNIASGGSPTQDPTPTNNFAPPVVTLVTNIPPVANPDGYAIAENSGTNAFNPLTNDVVLTPGGSLTIVTASATNGTVVISGTNILFVPATNFVGTATIGYTITDNVGGTNSALITVTVTNVPPVANPDFYSVAQNTTNIFSPLVNDVVRTPGGSLTIISVNPTNGTAAISGTNIIFTPTNNFIGTTYIGYTITDGIGGTNSALITVSVANVPPIANPDSYAMSENTTNTFSPLVNDVVVTPGGSLTIIAVNPTNGAAAISGTNIIFTPTNNFTGTATIGYTIIDNVGGTNSSLITITVTNVPPLANPDSYAMIENTTNTFSPLVNDIVRTPGGSLSIVSVSATNGAATISGTNVIFAPTNNFTGTAYIGYTITDNVGGTNRSLITVTVTNLAPVADTQSVTTTENTAKAITLTGSDGGNLPLTFVIVTSPTNGTLSLLNTNTGAVTYTPNTNYVGNDSFTFRVNNGQISSSPAAVSVTVQPVADIIVVQSGPTNGLAGSNLVYTVSVTNRGPATASSIVVTNQLSPGFTFVSASGNGSNASNIVTWNIAALPLNGVTNLTVKVFAAEGGTFTNFACGLAATVDLNLTNNNGSLTNARTRTVITPLADVEIFKDGGTNVFAGQAVDYTITATNAGPSTATNVIVQDNLPAGATLQNASGSYTLSNGVVRWAGMTMPPGTATTFTLTLLAPTTSFLNIALATSPTADPNPTNNNGSFSKSRVSTQVTPSADLVVLLVGPATATEGSNYVYNLTVTNAGPSTSSNVVVSDSLPLGLTFVAASSGGKLTNGVTPLLVTPLTPPATSNLIVWPLIKSLAFGAKTNYTITVNPQYVGLFTNIASAVAVTSDPDSTNNSGVAPVSQALTEVQLSPFGILAGTPVFNPQTGLYEETVAVTNSSDVTILGFRLHVSGLTKGVTLWNADGTSNSVPFINYNFPVDPSNAVSVILEFYDPARVSFTNTLTAEAILPGDASISSTNGSVAVTRVFSDTRIEGDTRFVIEFASVPGKTYVILYSSDLATWVIATPSVKASANVTQWYDDGPPKTVSKPASVNARYYRIIQF